MVLRSSRRVLSPGKPEYYGGLTLFPRHGRRQKSESSSLFVKVRCHSPQFISGGHLLFPLPKSLESVSQQTRAAIRASATKLHQVLRRVLRLRDTAACSRCYNLARWPRPGRLPEGSPRILFCQARPHSSTGSAATAFYRARRAAPRGQNHACANPCRAAPCTAHLRLRR